MTVPWTVPPTFYWDDFGYNQILLNLKAEVQRKPNPWAAVNPVSTLTFQRHHSRAHTRAQFTASEATFTTSPEWDALTSTITMAYLYLDPGTGTNIKLYPPSPCTTDWIKDYVEVVHNDNRTLHVHVYWDAYSSWDMYDYIELATRD